MGGLQVWLIGAAVLGTYLFAVLRTQQWGLGTRDNGSVAYPYLLEDVYDRSAYQKRGRWAVSGATPYLQEFSEYPQLTTWLMGLPYAFFDHGVERGTPYDTRDEARAFFVAAGIPKNEVELVFRRVTAFGLVYEPAALESGTDHPMAEAWRGLDTVPGIDREAAREHLLRLWRAYEKYYAELGRNYARYADIHHVLMAGLFALLLALVIANLRLLGAPPALALLLLLPGGLYFGFNRHDLPVTMLVALAVHLQLRGRYLAAGFALGFAVMTKWYPLVLVPLFLSHGYWSARLGVAAMSAQAALARQVLLPGIAAALVIVSVLAVTFVWHGGGVPAVTAVFEWHRSVRVPNHASLLVILTNPAAWGWWPESIRDNLSTWFQALALLPPLGLALLPLRSRAAWLEAAILATCGMVIFSKFFSPQWVLWIVALALLRARERPVYLALVVALQVAIYVQFPLTWYAGGAETGVIDDGGRFWLATSTRVVLLFAFQAVAAFGLVRALRMAPAPAPSTAAAAG